MTPDNIRETLTGVCSHLINQGKLPIITIYYNTADRPNLYTARVFAVQSGTANPTKIAYSHPLISQLRDCIPEGMVRMTRNDNDDPTVIESWL